MKLKIKHQQKGQKKRKKPTLLAQTAKLNNQKNKCFYCGQKFDEWYVRDGFARLRKPVWDHLSPYSYSFDNSNDNFVAACATCNAIKGARIFDSFLEAAQYVRKRRQEKGYVTLPVWGNNLCRREYRNEMVCDATFNSLPTSAQIEQMSAEELQTYVAKAKFLQKTFTPLPTPVGQTSTDLAQPVVDNSVQQNKTTNT